MPAAVIIETELSSHAAVTFSAAADHVSIELWHDNTVSSAFIVASHAAAGGRCYTLEAWHNDTVIIDIAGYIR